MPLFLQRAHWDENTSLHLVPIQLIYSEALCRSFQTAKSLIICVLFQQCIRCPVAMTSLFTMLLVGAHWYSTYAPAYAPVWLMCINLVGELSNNGIRTYMEVAQVCTYNKQLTLTSYVCGRSKKHNTTLCRNQVLANLFYPCTPLLIKFLSNTQLLQCLI